MNTVWSQRFAHPRSLLGLLSVLLSTGLTPLAPGAEPLVPKASPEVSLKQAYHGIFHVGVALNPGQFNGQNTQGAALVAREFDSISPENALKWDAIEPADGQFRFEQADRYVAFGLANQMFIIGHNLCWHSQLPAWVSEPEPGQPALTKEVLIARLRRHVLTLAGRYKGKINGWDVLNEAITDQGEYRDSIFYRVIGKEYVALLFKWAREADPKTELYYNDYNLDVSDAKRTATIELVKYLREQGAPIDGIGMQGHYNLNNPTTAKIDETIHLFSELGVKVMITELDVQVNRKANATVTGAVGVSTDGPPPATPTPPPVAQTKSLNAPAGGGAPVGPPPLPLTEVEQQALAKRYGEIFAVFLKNRTAITRVTLWGLRDADSWRRKNSPLLFDDSYARKPAYDAVIAAATESKR